MIRTCRKNAKLRTLKKVFKNIPDGKRVLSKAMKGIVGQC